MSSEQNSSRSNDQIVFQQATALARAGDDLEIAQTVARMFLEYGPEWLEQLRQASADADWQTTQRLAHMIKGSGDNLDCQEVRQAAWSMESAIQSGEHDAIETMLSELNRAIERCRPHLIAFCESDENPS